MTDGTLSQDEINDLLKSAGLGGEAPAPAQPAPASAAPAESTEVSIASHDIDALYEMLQDSIKKVSVTLGILLGGKNLQIKDFSKFYGSSDQVKEKFYEQGLYVEQKVKGDISGSIYFFYNIDIARYFIDILLGGTGQNPPAVLEDSHITAARELTDQVFPALIGDLSDKYGKKIDLEPSYIKHYQSRDEIDYSSMGKDVLKIDFRFDVDGGSKVGDGCIVVSESILKGLLAKKESVIAAAAQPAAQPQPSYQPQPQFQPQPTYQQAPGGQTVRPVEFAPLQPGQIQGAFGNINLLLDVPMEITVELGRARKLVKDILSLSQGSIIELDKMAGEAVDLLVNGKLIARGEVVVVGEENFGVRITEIVSPYERLNSLK